MKSILRFTLLILCLIILGCTGGDGNGGSGTTPPPGSQDNPVPVLSSLNPTAALKNQGEFTLTATGSSFVDGAKIVFKGQEQTTTFVSASELSCEISENLITGSGMDTPMAAVQVKVRNPAPGGGDSQVHTFHLRDNPTFGTDQVIAQGFDAHFNGLACDSEGRLYAWFQDTSSSEIESGTVTQTGAYVTRSEDYGQSWNTPVKMNLAGTPDWPSLAPGSNGELTVVWSALRGWKVIFKRSTDYGASWTVGKDLTPGFMPIYEGTTFSRCLIDGNGVIHVMLGRNDAEEWARSIYYLRSSDHGAHWTTNEMWNEGHTSPLLALGNGILYSLFQDHPYWNATYRYKHHTHVNRSLNLGLNWQSAQRVSEIRGCRHYPNVGLAAGPNNRVAAAWTFANAFCIRTSGNQAVTWNARKVFSAGGGVIGHLDLDYDALGNLMVVWVEDGIVYFRRSVNNADSWSAPVMVTQTTGCTMPQLVITPDGSIFVSWLRGNRIHFVEGIPE